MFFACFFFSTYPASSLLYPLSLHDALPILLALAAVVVGIAISIEGDSRRVVNGIGGIIWIAAAAQITIRAVGVGVQRMQFLDRKSTRLNSSHLVISYAVFCLKKKNRKKKIR